MADGRSAAYRVPRTAHPSTSHKPQATSTVMLSSLAGGFTTCRDLPYGLTFTPKVPLAVTSLPSFWPVALIPAVYVFTGVPFLAVT